MIRYHPYDYIKIIYCMRRMYREKDTFGEDSILVAIQWTVFILNLDALPIKYFFCNNSDLVSR